VGKKKIVTKSGGESGGKFPKTAEGNATSKKAVIGRVYINSSFNNTIITATTKSGDVLAWASAGSMGFSGPKKATPFAASKVVSAIVEKLKTVGKEEIEVFIRGVGSGRDSAIRSLINQGFNVVSVKDMTPIPHNGPKAPKPRRV